MPYQVTDLGEAFDAEVVDTDGVVIQDIPDDGKVPYSIARAVQFARDPANAQTIQTFSDEVAAGYRKTIHKLDDNVTRTKDLLVALIDDDGESGGIKDAFFNSLVKQFTGIED